MFTWIAVAVGGALGSVVRHGVNRLVHQQWPSLRFPLATVAVNLVFIQVAFGLGGVYAGLVAVERIAGIAR
jgi:fluoride ion exporter CrcB/FEX